MLLKTQRTKFGLPNRSQRRALRKNSYDSGREHSIRWYHHVNIRRLLHCRPGLYLVQQAMLNVAQGWCQNVSHAGQIDKIDQIDQIDQIDHDLDYL